MIKNQGVFFVLKWIECIRLNTSLIFLAKIAKIRGMLADFDWYWQIENFQLVIKKRSETSNQFYPFFIISVE